MQELPSACCARSPSLLAWPPPRPCSRCKEPEPALLSPSTLSLSLSPSLLLLALQPAPCLSPWPAAAELRPHRSCYRPLLLRPSHHHYQRRHPVLRPACRFFELQRHRPQLSSWPQPRPAVLMWPGHYGPPRAKLSIPTHAREAPGASPTFPRRRWPFSGRHQQLLRRALFFTRDQGLRLQIRDL